MTVMMNVQTLKDGSWNSMISAHPSGQIQADLGICPYCFMVEESNVRKEPYILIVNPFQPTSCMKKWANNPQYRDPSFSVGVFIFDNTQIALAAFPNELVSR